jgi:phage-related protein
MHTAEEYAEIYAAFPCNAFKELWDWVRNTHSEEGEYITLKEHAQLKNAQTADLECFSERNNILNQYRLEDLNELQTENILEVGYYIDEELQKTEDSLNSSIEYLNDGVVEIKDTIEEIPDAIRETIDDTMGGVSDSIDDFKISYEQQESMSRDVIDLLKETLARVIGSGLENVAGTYQQSSEVLAKVQTEMSSNIANGFFALYNSLEETISDDIKNVKDGILTNAKVLKETAISGIENAKNNFNKLKESITQGMKIIDNILDVGFELLTNSILNFVPSLFEAVNNMFDFSEADFIRQIKKYKSFFENLAEAMIED